MNSKGWVSDSIFCERLGLTRREMEVLSWVTDGKTNTEIGVILSTSPRTVQKHLEHIFEKLGVETRTAAVVRALALTSPRSVESVGVLSCGVKGCPSFSTELKTVVLLQTL